jgi:hypothetical protein
MTLLDANSAHGLVPKTLELMCEMKITERGPQTVLPDARLHVGDHVHSLKRANSCLIGFPSSLWVPFSTPPCYKYNAICYNGTNC